VSVQPRRIVIPSANVSLLYPALALFLSIFAVAPLSFPGFFQSYTGYSAVYNLFELHGRLASFYTWTPTWGTPYDLFRMDGPLGYWLAEFFHIIGFSPLDAIKLVYTLAFLLSAFGMFKLAQHVLKNDAAALLAAVVYVYFPAHIATVYIRGNFGEALAWGLFPFTLWSAIALEQISHRDRRQFLWCILAFGALMLSQAGFAVLFSIFALVWLVFLPPNPLSSRRFPAHAAVAMLGGLLLGFLFLLPALIAQNAIFYADSFTPAFVYPFQFLTASWGTDLPTGDFMENAPYQIGFAALGLTILAIALLLLRGMQDHPVRRLVWFAVITSALLLVLMMPIAAPLWNLGLGLLVQYPFQLLALVGFLLSFAAASVLVTDTQFQQIPLLAAFVIVPILAVYPYLSPEFIEFSPTKPALARFNNGELALLDAKILRPPGTWRHGATVELQLTWQAIQQPNRDYTVFMHILDENGEQWGATDEKPQGDELSTLKWVPGRIYQDTHSVQIDLNGPDEGYYMDLGIYQSTTGERAFTEVGTDSVRIDENR
jgi:hypothetical protein